jgi:hypothetical protein
VSIAWTDVISAVIAAFAAGIALFTFVYQFTLKPQLDAQLGQQIIVHYTAKGQLILTASFVFLNKGAMPIAMTSLSATIWAAGADEPGGPNLTWRQFEEVQRVNAIGEPADYRYGSSGAVKTLVIPGRGASPCYTVRFYSRGKLELGAGMYSLIFRAVGGSTRVVKESKLMCSLVLNEDDAAILKHHGHERDGDVDSRISFDKIFSSAGSRDSRTARARSAILREKPTIRFESEGVWSPTPQAPPDATKG